MSASLHSLKASVDLQTLATETHRIDRNGLVHCPNPAHEDKHPSCHIRPNTFRCFACGCGGDIIDWYVLVHDCTTREAIRALREREAGYPQTRRRQVEETAYKLTSTFTPVPASVLDDHKRRALTLTHIPKALTGRGFTLASLRQHGIAAMGDDAVFPLPGPDGSVLALKRRYSAPKGAARYGYTTKGHGSPAWCSPDFMANPRVLIIEGELNAMICYMAAPQLSVMGVAGANGTIHAQSLTCKEVYVYADGDALGENAKRRWCRRALEAGAAAVFALEPWPADACDIAGTHGIDALRERLT